MRPATKALLTIGEQSGNQPDNLLETEQSNLALDKTENLPQLEQGGLTMEPNVKDKHERVNLIDDVISHVSETPMKRLEQMIEFDEDQAASVLTSWVNEESAA